MPKCYCCSESAVVEEHHLIPRASGGEKAWTIWLCAKHHALAHKLALSKKPLESIHAVNERLAKVVLIIRKAKQVLPHAPYYKMTLKIPTKLHKRLKLDVKAKKASSLEKRVISILLQHYTN